MLVGTGEFFEEVGILDGGGDFVVAACPFSEVDAAAAVGAEGDVFASGEDDVAAGGTAECLCGDHNIWMLPGWRWMGNQIWKSNGNCTDRSWFSAFGGG